MAESSGAIRGQKFHLDRALVAKQVLLVFACYASGRLGLELTSVGGVVTTVWPPAGIATAAVLLGGLRYCPAVFLSAILIDLDWNGLSIATPGIAVANTLQPLLTAVLLRKLGFNNRMTRLSDLVNLMAIGVVLASGVAATIGMASAVYAGQVLLSEAGRGWWAWFFGDTVSVLVLTPLLLTLYPPWAALGRKKAIRFLILMTLLLVQVIVIFSDVLGFGITNYLLSYTVLPVMLWIGVGVGLREASFANLLVSIFAVRGAVNAEGLFANSAFTDNVFLLHGYLLVSVGACLLMAAASEERRVANRRSRVAEHRLETVMNHSAASIYMKDAEDGRYIIANQTFSEHVGQPLETILGCTDAELFPREVAEGFGANDRRVAEIGEQMSFEENLVLPDGSQRVMLSVKFPLHDESGRVYATGGVSTDISDRISIESQLRENERRYRNLFESAFDAVLILSEGVITDCNTRASDLFQCPREDLIGSEFGDFLPDTAQSEDLLHPYQPQGGVGEVLTVDTIVIPKKGLPKDVEALHQRIELNGQNYDYTILRDVSKRKRAERLLRHQANYDPLTDLPNRLFAFERLEQAMSEAASKSCRVSVLFLDLDLFKNINDTLGHVVGDELLIKVGQRLVNAVSTQDMVARLGGDEFLVVISGCEGADQVVPIARQLLKSVNQPYQVGTHELFISTSIGITFFPEDGNDPETLLRNADAAMYAAKSKGRSTFAFFTRELEEKGRRRLLLESHLRHAIEHQELSLVYQPEYDIASGRIVAMEALLRWHNETVGQVSPTEFIEIAEESGFISELGAWVIDNACAEAATWQQRLGHQVRLAINVSPGQFHDNRALLALEKAIAQHGLQPGQIELEITESLLLGDSADVRDKVAALLDLGLSLTLDDFGTGYSSISYLKMLPFSTLKLDRSFVSGVESNEDAARMCRSILALAASLKIEVVGEGVETEGQLKFLTEQGANRYQGYLGSRPVPSSEIEALFS
jgi:diguanylate cyclase (GGDEF)-like protein/PAS domain S-box-containing protein